MEATFVPGTIVRNPDAPEWGEGQVQSAIGDKITVNFPDHGKLVIDRRHVPLEVVRPG